MVCSTFNPAETVIKLSKVPARVGFSRRTVDNWRERGLEVWSAGPGGLEVTTLEAIARFMVPVEVKQQVTARFRGRSADADIAALLALK